MSSEESSAHASGFLRVPIYPGLRSPATSTNPTGAYLPVTRDANANPTPMDPSLFASYSDGSSVQGMTIGDIGPVKAPELLRVGSQIPAGRVLNNYELNTGALGDVQLRVPGPCPATTIKPSGFRSQLSDEEKVMLIRLCCKYGEEYLGAKGKYWLKMTAMINRETGKAIGNARTVVNYLYASFQAEEAQDERDSGKAYPDTEMRQALRAWRIWVDRAEGRKGIKGGTEEEIQRRETELAQNNMMVTMSKKRVFRDALAAAGSPTPSQSSAGGNTREGTLSGTDDDGIAKSNQSAAAMKRQKTDKAVQKKRQMRDRIEISDNLSTAKEDALITIVDRLANHIIERDTESTPLSPTASDIRERLFGLERGHEETSKALSETRRNIGDMMTAMEDSSRKQDAMMTLLQTIAGNNPNA